jgi:cell division FtsZ-interacting protein ZapD
MAEIHFTEEVIKEAERQVREVRRTLAESLIHLPSWDADRVTSLLDKLEEAVEGRTVARLAGREGSS